MLVRLQPRSRFGFSGSAALFALSVLASACTGDEALPGGGTSGATAAGTGGADAGASGTAATEPPIDTGRFPPVTDFAAPGRFETLQEAGGLTCTTFRPMTLGADGVPHPVIVWGNGTFLSVTSYAGVLTHWASHGFIVAAANTSNAGTGAEMIACMEWVLAENARAGSPYEGHVDAVHIGASGHSQGGGGAIMVGRDARIVVTAPLQPYTSGLGHDSTSWVEQNGPMFLMSGENDNIAGAGPNQLVVFNATNVPVFWGILAGADHLVSGTGDITGYRGPATAWFRLHLMGDESGRALFYGADCGLCVDPMWDVQRKGIE